jgi:hypothetical protein
VPENLRPRLSFANVISVVALFIALGGGAYALSRDSVKSRHIAKGAVKGSDLRAEAVKAKHVRDAAIGTGELADGAVTGDDLTGNSVGARHVVQSSLDELETAAATASLSGQPDLAAGFADTIATAITLEEPKTVVALATIEAEATGAGPHRVGCLMRIADEQSADAFVETIPVTATADEATISVSFASSLPAGTHQIALRCQLLAGAGAFVEQGDLSAWAVG